VDEELSTEDCTVVTAHVETCTGCREHILHVRRMSTAIAQLGREVAPNGLSLRIERRLRCASERQWRRLHNVARQVAALAACCALSALITWWLMSSAGQASRLEQEVVAAHVRSLLQDSPVQVASSDAHNVKPWFAGRVDFAPDVKDLTAEGFPLVGG